MYAPVLAAGKLPGISVTAIEKNINTGPFLDLIKNATANQNAPDIAFIPNGPALAELAANGDLIPMDKCGIKTDDWSGNIYPNRHWAHPFESEVLMLFYSKVALRQLGWNNADIENLPTQIANNAITFEDLLSIAQRAIDSGAVKKGFAFTVHENRFDSTMLLYQIAGGKLVKGSLANKEALLSTFQYYEKLHKPELMHPAISQDAISSVTNRFALRDALAHGRILFALTVTSEWSRMLLDHSATLADLQQNVGISLFPSAATNGAAIMSAMGSYVVFSKNATGRNHQAAACRVIRTLAASDFHKQHAVRTSQPVPDGNAIWSPPQLPALTLKNILYTHTEQADHQHLPTRLNEITARIATSDISAEQALVLNRQQLPVHQK
jgi:ABC-type glycerol-3-phosphate transport system substrate-binding protein